MKDEVKKISPKKPEKIEAKMNTPKSVKQEKKAEKEPIIKKKATPR